MICTIINNGKLRGRVHLEFEFHITHKEPFLDVLSAALEIAIFQTVVQIFKMQSEY